MGLLKRARDFLTRIGSLPEKVTNIQNALGRIEQRQITQQDSSIQEAEFKAEALGYTATRHQREVGTGYFDEVAQVLSGGAASTLAMHDSTETAQF